MVLLDPSDRVLLLEASDPARPAKGPWWELPGGGVEGAEATATAAARELYEETGIDCVEMGPCVWRHHATFTFAGYHFDQHEHVHVARSDGGEYRPAGLEALEVMAFKGARWWPFDELAAHALPQLVDQLPAVLAASWPLALSVMPIDMGELGDIA